MDLNAKEDVYGATPLHMAAANGNKKIAEFLITKGADLNARNDNGGTPLVYAAQIGHKEVAELLIDKGADVDEEDGFGATPLRHAVGKGHKEIAEMLIAAGADVNWIGKQAGTTLLHEASIKGQKEVAKLLIAKGVNINAKVASGPKQGLTALDAAHETNHPETADLLRKHGGKTGAELKAAGN